MILVAVIARLAFAVSMGVLAAIGRTAMILEHSPPPD
jgi:hypothetical protein